MAPGVENIVNQPPNPCAAPAYVAPPLSVPEGADPQHVRQQYLRSSWGHPLPSPGGTKECSLGRQPQERELKSSSEVPEGRHLSLNAALISPRRGFDTFTVLIPGACAPGYIIPPLRG